MIGTGSKSEIGNYYRNSGIGLACDPANFAIIILLTVKCRLRSRWFGRKVNRKVKGLIVNRPES